MLHNGLTKHEAKKGKEAERRRKEKKRKREWELCTVPIHPNKQDLLSFQTKTILLISWCFTSLVRHGALRLWYIMVLYVFGTSWCFTSLVRHSALRPHKSQCVWGVCGGGGGACMSTCVCVYIVIVKYFPCIWAVSSSVFHWVVDVLC